MKIIKHIVTLSIVALLTFLSAGQVSANTLDPISVEEISRVMQFAAFPNKNLQARGADFSDGALSPTPQKLEFLGVKAHRFEKSKQNDGHRWADTLVYDYATDELITTVINLDTNNVISVQRSRDMQPPLSDNELEKAMTILFEDDEEFSLLAAEFKQVTGEALISKEQLRYKAFTFFADSMPNIVNEASKECGAQRCAQILAYTTDRISFQYSPIVNLSAGVITQRISY